MAERTDNSEDETRSLIVAITDFLRDQLITRTDLVAEDKDCLEIAIQSLEIAYGLEGNRYLQYRFSRPLMDIFNQVTNPVSVKDKIRADAHKDAGNDYMRRRMFQNAEAEYTYAIELDKWNSIYYCNRASSRNEQRNFFEAIADCRHALMLNPDYAKAHARMGQAYALLHRPREAARCFRQALELEPENERYRHNLRVAENQINTPDVAQVITNLLGTLFGVGPRTTEDRSTRILPPSFMIITESHPPTQGTSSQTPEAVGNTDISQAMHCTPVTKDGEQENESALLTNNNRNNILFPQPFGIIDQGREEQPIIEFNQSTETEDHENETEEFVLNIPLISFEFIPPTQPSTLQPESTLENVEKEDESSTTKKENNDETALSPHENEKKQNGIESTRTLQNQNASGISNKQNDNNSRKITKQAPIQVHEKKGDTLNSDRKEEGLSNNAFNEEQKETSCNSNDSSNILCSTENSRDNSNRISSQIGNQHKTSDDSSDEKSPNPFILGNDDKHVKRNNINARTQNEEINGGETSEKLSPFEEEVD